MKAMAVITFSYSCAQQALVDMAMDFATDVSPRIEGLVWKMYLNDPDRHRSAGVYLFSDSAAAENYVNGPILEGLRQTPTVAEVHAEVFETMDAASILSGAPLGTAPGPGRAGP